MIILIPIKLIKLFYIFFYIYNHSNEKKCALDNTEQPKNKVDIRSALWSGIKIFIIATAVFYVLKWFGFTN